jgi:excisionase family DNA binding protein
MAAKKKSQPEFVTHPLGTEIYTVEQVAKSLNLSPKYVYKAINEGRLEAKKTGKQFLITREAVRKFWDSLPSAADRPLKEKF